MSCSRQILVYVVLSGLYVCAHATGACSITGETPKERDTALVFCDMFPEKNCCLPAQLFCYGCNPEEYMYTQDNTISICKSFAEKVDPKHFDDCGIIVPTSRGDLCATNVMIVPSVYYAGDTSLERASLFLNDTNSGRPPFFASGFNLNICDPDTDSSCVCYNYSAAWTPQNRHFLAVALTLLLLYVQGL